MTLNRSDPGRIGTVTFDDGCLRTALPLGYRSFALTVLEKGRNIMGDSMEID